ncbi:MAG: hypothetical protein NUV50_04415 [Rhodospirillales bacterium]|nr:hypothetical protein [Rhodospirillales bacterium]
MFKSERPGYAIITIEVPIEVAEWLAANGEHLAQIASIAVAKIHLNSEATKLQRQWNVEARRVELWKLGRMGYRLFRRFNGGKNVGTRIELISEISTHLGCNAQALKFSITRFKRDLETRVLKRRGREMARLCAAGLSNPEIAARYDVHPNTIVRCLREHKAEMLAYARDFPGKSNGLKTNNKGMAPESSLGSRDPISWEAVKQAGRRA